MPRNLPPSAVPSPFASRNEPAAPEQPGADRRGGLRHRDRLRSRGGRAHLQRLHSSQRSDHPKVWRARTWPRDFQGDRGRPPRHARAPAARAQVKALLLPSACRLPDPQKIVPRVSSRRIARGIAHPREKERNKSPRYRATRKPAEATPRRKSRRALRFAPKPNANPSASPTDGKAPWPAASKSRTCASTAAATGSFATGVVKSSTRIVRPYSDSFRGQYQGSLLSDGIRGSHFGAQ